MQEFVCKKSLIDTMRSFKLKETRIIKRRDFKTQSVNNAKRKLRKEGYDFRVTERGIIDGCEVTRTA